MKTFDVDEARSQISSLVATAPLAPLRSQFGLEE